MNKIKQSAYDIRCCLSFFMPSTREVCLASAYDIRCCLSFIRSIILGMKSSLRTTFVVVYQMAIVAKSTDLDSLRTTFVVVYLDN